MKLERKLWILTLLLAFVMVIPSVALAQGDACENYVQQYDLNGRWSMQEIEVCKDFCSGTTEIEPQDPEEFCIVHDTGSNSFGNILIYTTSGTLVFIGRTGSYFIGFASASHGNDQDAFTGRVAGSATFIQGSFIYNASDDEEPCTGVNRFSMTKVPDPGGVCTPSF